VKTRRVLDAYALLSYLNEESGHARVKSLLESGDTELLVNAVNVGETFYVLARARGGRDAEYFLNVILPSLPVTVVGNTLDDVIDAARLKAVHAISLADCFAAATAVRERAPLVTGDPEFKKLGNALELDWIE
jgi:predicted nucleic acid-binding protein